MNGGMRVAAYEKSKSVKLKSISTMTEGTIWRQILLFSIPLILGNLLQQMYNTVDSIIVGNFVGSNALAAVGSSTSLISADCIQYGGICRCGSYCIPVLWSRR